MIIFFQIFLNSPPHEIFIHPLVPQRKQEKLAKVSLAKVTLAKVSLCQSVTLAKVSRPKCLWPKCHSGRSVIQPDRAESQFGQNDNLARDTLAGTLWPE